MLQSNGVVVVIGTTGVGKSQLAVDLALSSSATGQVINADSMQVYRGLDILTNKMTGKEMRGVEHALLGFVDPFREYNVGQFCEDAEGEIERCHEAGTLVILAGGTAYYVQTLLFPARRIDTRSEHMLEDVLQALVQHDDMRARLRTLDADQLELLKLIPSLPNTPSPSALPPDFPFDRLSSSFQSAEALASGFFALLVALDPAMSERWHPRDIRKIRRSLEICLARGRPASEVVAEQDEGEAASAKWPTLVFWLRADDNVLAKRLDMRVDKMVEAGLMDEVRELRSMSREGQRVDDTTSGVHQAIGYREMAGYLSPPCTCSHAATHPVFETDEERFAHAIDRTKISTRQYAKRQTSWIERRLLPQIAAANNVHLAVLDATDPDRWTEVSARACEVYQRWRENVDLSGEKAEALTWLGVANAILSPSANLENQRFLACETCSTSTGQPLRLARGQMESHIKSKGHRHRLKQARA